MKYLIAQKPSPPGTSFPDLLFPILFPDMITHSSIAAGLKEERATVRSAGFFSIEPTRAGIRIAVHDHSSSLNLSPHPDDATLIRDWLRYGDTFSLTSQLLAETLNEGPVSAPSDVLQFPSQSTKSTKVHSAHL